MKDKHGKALARRYDDLALTSPALGPLRVWEIPEEYPSFSDHELILVEWEDSGIENLESRQPALSRWNIQNLLEDDKLLQAAKEDWENSSLGRTNLGLSSTVEDLDEEVEWFESELVKLLNNHAKLTRVTAYSKRWWNEEVAEARKVWAKNKKRLSESEAYREELKQARNQYYRTIRKAKRLCWQNFLQGSEPKPLSHDQLPDQRRCWTALKYTKQLQFKTMPTLRDADGCSATSMTAKEALVRKSAFPKPPQNLKDEPVVVSGIAHMEVTQSIVAHALMSQSASKAPGPDKINFRTLRMI